MSERFYKVGRELAARRDIPAGAKLVRAIIGDHQGRNSVAWPGLRLLAQESGMSCEAVLENIRRLEAAGLLRVERRGSGRSNRYALADGPSAQESRALKKPERSGKPNSGAQETRAQALRKPEQNQTDQLNQTQEKRPAARRKKSNRKPTVTWDAKAGRFIVPPELLARWRRDYPGIDVDRELVKAANWQTANPLKKNPARFLVNWLNRTTPSRPTTEADRPPGDWSTASTEPAAVVCGRAKK